MTAFNLQTAASVIADVFPSWVLALAPQVVAIERDRTVLHIPFSAQLCREGGIVSGQALAAVADTAMVCALWAAQGAQRPVATVDLHVSYLRAAAQDDLLATAEVVKQGRALCFARVSIASASDPSRPAATAVGTFASGG